MKIIFILITLITMPLISCDSSEPSYEKKREVSVQKHENEANLAKQELTNFANSFNALQLKITNKLTIDLQDDYQNKTVALRARLKDIYKTSQGKLEAVFITGSTLNVNYYQLSLSHESAEEIKLLTSKDSKYLLISIHVSNIKPILLSAKACGEPDCTDVSITTNTYGLNRTSYIVTGKFIGASQLKH